jgi:dTDP-4-dehydrorhamnose reductase
MRVLILGVTGMLGHTVFDVFRRHAVYDVWGTARAEADKQFFAEADRGNLIAGVDVLDQDAVVALMATVRPEVVINCVGLIKQLAASNDPLLALPINALAPHRLARVCELAGARLVLFSSDCVFSGRKGNYTESDVSDAEDLYGKSKYIGEIHQRPGVITLRTSVIGPELNSHRSLLGWFLSQQASARGYRRAIFSGLPTVELARVLHDFVLPHPELSGVYHVASRPINKLALLTQIAAAYGKDIRIDADDTVAIDRSLDSTRFTAATGYVAPEWPDLIAAMRDYSRSR